MVVVTYRAARRIFERVSSTRHTSRLLRRPYSPTVFNSESLKRGQSIDKRHEQSTLVFSGRSVHTDEQTRKDALGPCRSSSTSVYCSMSALDLEGNPEMIEASKRTYGAILLFVEEKLVDTLNSRSLWDC